MIDRPENKKHCSSNLAADAGQPPGSKPMTGQNFICLSCRCSQCRCCLYFQCHGLKFVDICFHHQLRENFVSLISLSWLDLFKSCLDFLLENSGLFCYRFLQVFQFPYFSITCCYAGDQVLVFLRFCFYDSIMTFIQVSFEVLFIFLSALLLVHNSHTVKTHFVNKTYLLVFLFLILNLNLNLNSSFFRYRILSNVSNFKSTFLQQNSVP